MASIFFGLSLFFITNSHVLKGVQLEPVPGLCPIDNGHGPIFQKGADQFAVYLQAAVVLDKAFLLEPIHKFTYPRAGGTNHLRERCLAHLQRTLRV